MPTRKPIRLRRPPTVSKSAIKPSKRVADRQRATLSLLGAIQHYKTTVAAGIEKRLGAHLRDGESLTDQALVLELVGRSLQAAIDVLLRSDMLYGRQARRRKALNDRCARLAREQIYPELVDVRRAVDARFGRKAGFSVHGIKGDTRRQPRPQLEILERLISTLRDGPLPEPLRPAPDGERRGWLRQLEPGFRQLREILDELAHREIREARRRDDRDYELESFDLGYAEALAYLRGVLRLAGGDDADLWSLLPNVQRRRLRRKARRESEARAEGRRSRGEDAQEDPRS